MPGAGTLSIILALSGALQDFSGLWEGRGRAVDTESGLVQECGRVRIDLGQGDTFLKIFESSFSCDDGSYRWDEIDFVLDHGGLYQGGAQVGEIRGSRLSFHVRDDFEDRE